VIKRGLEERDVAEPSEDRAPDDAPAQPGAPVVIKKYANRRLYNTATSSYVTLEHLSEMVRENVDFVVQDAKTGEDITRSVLTQIIFDQENRGQSVLPVQFLRRLIRFYGDSMQGFLPAYLEMSMETFSKSQDQLREQYARAFGAKNPMVAFEEQARQNMALFQQAVRMWTPFVAANPPPKTDEPAAAGADENLAELKRQMEAMQRQLDQLTGGRKP
jgi:polyhydroxyalkanoate synthesis repressor PhaR